MPQMKHEHLVLYGELDYWIPREHIEQMCRSLPHCRLEVFPGLGHSMNLESPQKFARIFSEFFQPGLASRDRSDTHTQHLTTRRLP
jgi:pimeloyl-ACP methyl ester carboxylesterase